MKFYDIIVKLFGWVVKKLYRMHVYGEENEIGPSENGLIICSNHISAKDVITLAACLKKNRIRFMAKIEVFKIPVMKQFATAMGAFPINRNSNDVSAIKKTIALLKNGETVGMFPQGTRCTGVDPSISSVKNGVGLIAYRSGATVLPVYIQTTDYKMRLFHRTNLFIGKPIENSELGFNEGNQSEYSVASHLIFERILELNRPVDELK